MLGAIAGDIIGSEYEFGKKAKTKDFPIFESGAEAKTFTDDTVLTVATAEALLHGGSYAEIYKKYANMYKSAGYGPSFKKWAFNEGIQPPYNSWGNGSAMRVSPIGWVFNDSTHVIIASEKSAECTHNHEEGIKGAQATALAIMLAKNGSSKEDIKKQISYFFEYNLDRTCDDIRPDYKFDVSCQGSVPESIIAFLDSEDYEDAIRNAVSLGGDTDTQACISGAIAEAYYKEIPEYIIEGTYARLDDQLINVLEEFRKKHVIY